MDQPADSPTAPRSLPKAQFIDDVQKFSRGRDISQVIEELNENYKVYKYLEQELVQRKARLLGKLPEIQKATDAVKLLLAKTDGDEPVTFDFGITDQVFAKGKVSKCKHVYLWLGANIMVEYTLEDALELLDTNLKTAKHNLHLVGLDLDMLKDSITTTEVSIARVYNFDLTQKKVSKA